jgi:uncharacterized membrane protein
MKVAMTDERTTRFRRRPDRPGRVASKTGDVEHRAEASSTTPATILEMIQLEQREKTRMGAADRLADWITAIAGSMPFVALNALWFALWIGIQEIGIWQFDAFPFGLLTMIVSLEAIFLSLFVLISQNRQALVSDKRAKLDLQINLIAEQEVTKAIEMLSRIEKKLGSAPKDRDVEQMKRPTRIRELANEMDRVQRRLDKQAAKGPSSAADTEA